MQTAQPFSKSVRPAAVEGERTGARPAVASFEALTYWYPGSVEPALRADGLAIEPGLTLVAGGSGGGKSTLLRALDGLVPQFHGGRIAGSVRVAGLDPVATPIRAMARHVGLVFQDPETQSVYGTVEREVAFGLENAGMPRAEMHDRVDEALEAVGIGALRERRLATLSGGERQRVQLAAVLALRPEIVALDEPTSQLDTAGAASVVAACLRLAAAGRTLVVAEHRLEGLLPAADRVILVEGAVVTGPFAARDVAAASRLASPPPIVELGLALGWRPLPLDVEEARPHVIGAAPLPLERAPAAPRGEPVWELRGASIGPASGAEPVLDGVDLSGSVGEVVVLMGSNGSGKTSLLRAIAGLARPLSGGVSRRPGRVAFLPQNPGALLHLPTVRAEVALTLRRAGSSERPDTALAAFGLESLADRYPRDLSAGERQRAALAVVLAGSPGLALLDEPTRGMDLVARRRLVAAVRALAARGTSVVIATHDVDLAAQLADRVVVLDGGRAIDRGAPRVALAAGTPLATQIARLFPGGPVTVADAARAVGSR